MARKHGGSGWKNYDYLFRQQLAAGSNTVWSEVNPSLMASTALGMGIGPDPARYVWVQTTGKQSLH